MSIDVADNTAPVCQSCLGEPWLKDRVRSRGTVGSCRFCGNRGKCTSVGTLAAWVRDVLDQHFQHCHSWSYYGNDDHYSRYAQKGESLEHVVAELLEADVPLVDAVLEELTLIAPPQPDEAARPNYARVAHYAQRRAGAIMLEGGWDHFRHELKHRARLFNAYAKQFLDRLMADIHGLRPQGKRGNTVIRVVKPDQATLLFRARRASSPGQLEQILSAFGEQLGPPPPENAPAGRMNTAGVSAFYGAFDRKTSVAELRPSLGDTVVSGAFRLHKPVRLLDFALLEQCYKEQPLSYFQPDFKQKSACRHFLRRLHAKIRRPAEAGDEAEFLSTQVLAEYLSGVVKPRVDGVVYASAQRQKGFSVVLFSHALDIQLKTERTSIMGAESVLRICDNTAVVHRISGIDYHADDSQAKEDTLELSLDPNEYPDDDE